MEELIPDAGFKNGKNIRIGVFFQGVGSKGT